LRSSRDSGINRCLNRISALRTVKRQCHTESGVGKWPTPASASSSAPFRSPRLSLSQESV
jgi:hypothetical protein